MVTSSPYSCGSLRSVRTRLSSFRSSFLGKTPGPPGSLHSNLLRLHSLASAFFNCIYKGEGRSSEAGPEGLAGYRFQEPRVKRTLDVPSQHQANQCTPSYGPLPGGGSSDFLGDPPPDPCFLAWLGALSLVELDHCSIVDLLTGPKDVVVGHRTSWGASPRSPFSRFARRAVVDRFLSLVCSSYLIFVWTARAFVCHW
jgi:hypothetical protein